MSADAGKPRLTQSMTMHLNGGSKFSELHYKILANGKETGITRYKRTSGSPGYLVTDDFLLSGGHGGEEFDVLATKGSGMVDWILAHIKIDANGSPPVDEGTPS
jgi:hypothetical protein